MRIVAPSIALAVLFLIALAGPSRAQPWPVTSPTNAGLDEARLRKLTERIGGQGCVVRRGAMAFTWGDITKRRDVASAAKPVYGHFLLQAIESGRLRLEDRVAAAVPELEKLSKKDAAIRWRDLINQTSCYGVVERPGEAFDYSDYNMALFVDSLFLRVRGTTWDRIDSDVLRAELCDPLGCEDSPTFLAFGPDRNPGRLAISPRDFARFGLLYLRAGRWGDRVLLASESVRMATSHPLPGALSRTSGQGAPMLPGQRSIGGKSNQTDHFGSYSFAWWTNGVDRGGKRHWPGVPNDAFAALGHGGKRGLLIVPSLDMVATWNDTTISNENELVGALSELVKGTIEFADIFIKNARVITLDPSSRIAQAVALMGVNLACRVLPESNVRRASSQLTLKPQPLTKPMKEPCFMR